RQPVDGEVITELSVDEVVAAELLLPVPVRCDLVDQHRALLAAVAREIALSVAIDVQPPHHPRALDRLLPDPGVHRDTAPGHVAREADVHRKELRQRCALFRPVSRAPRADDPHDDCAVSLPVVASSSTAPSVVQELEATSPSDLRRTSVKRSNTVAWWSCDGTVL